MVKGKLALVGQDVVGICTSLYISTFSGSCNEMHLTDRGTIASQGFAAGSQYANDLDCNYTIHAVVKTNIILSINFLDVEQGDGGKCLYDWLMVRKLPI